MLGQGLPVPFPVPIPLGPFRHYSFRNSTICAARRNTSLVLLPALPVPVPFPLPTVEWGRNPAGKGRYEHKLDHLISTAVWLSGFKPTRQSSCPVVSFASLRARERAISSKGSSFRIMTLLKEHCIKEITWAKRDISGFIFPFALSLGRPVPCPEGIGTGRGRGREGTRDGKGQGTRREDKERHQITRQLMLD